MNRLQRVIGKYVSEEQAAFIVNHSITNNVLGVFEIIHYLKCRMKGRNGEVALNIDISKA